MKNYTTFITWNGLAYFQIRKEITPVDSVDATITRWTKGPAAQAGKIKEVRIVDMDDRLIFLAQNNSVVFPPPNNSQK